MTRHLAVGVLLLLVMVSGVAVMRAQECPQCLKSGQPVPAVRPESASGEEPNWALFRLSQSALSTSGFSERFWEAAGRLNNAQDSNGNYIPVLLGDRDAYVGHFNEEPEVSPGFDLTEGYRDVTVDTFCRSVDALACYDRPTRSLDPKDCD